MSELDLQARLAKPRFPRASRYDSRWVIENLMGPNVLWLAEHLSEAMDFRPGMRVLDLGCGKAVSSIFLAREFGVAVFAADLWIKPAENLARIAKQGLEDRVLPIHAEARALPFAECYFDRIVSLDAYHYFGTDDLYLRQILRFLKPQGRIGIVSPGLRHEIAEVPDALKPYWDPDFSSFHSPEWWRAHWQRTGLADVLQADLMPDGRALWLEWNRLCAKEGPEHFRASAAREAEMLEKDTDNLLGFVRVVGKRL